MDLFNLFQNIVTLQEVKKNYKSIENYYLFYCDTMDDNISTCSVESAATHKLYYILIVILCKRESQVVCKMQLSCAVKITEA